MRFSLLAFIASSPTVYCDYFQSIGSAFRGVARAFEEDYVPNSAPVKSLTKSDLWKYIDEDTDATELASITMYEITQLANNGQKGQAVKTGQSEFVDRLACRIGVSRSCVDVEAVAINHADRIEESVFQAYLIPDLSMSTFAQNIIPAVHSAIVASFVVGSFSFADSNSVVESIYSQLLFLRKEGVALDNDVQKLTRKLIEKGQKAVGYLWFDYVSNEQTPKATQEMYLDTFINGNRQTAQSSNWFMQWYESATKPYIEQLISTLRGDCEAPKNYGKPPFDYLTISDQIALKIQPTLKQIENTRVFSKERLLLIIQVAYTRLINNWNLVLRSLRDPKAARKILAAVV